MYNGNRNNNNGNWNNNNNRSQRKHSGAKMGQGKNGKRFISAWNYSRKYGLVSLIASMRETGKNTCVNRNGEQLEIFVCKVQKKYEQPQLFTGFYNPNDGKLRIPDLGMTVNPKAPNGGYWGKTAVSRNRR